MSFTRAFSTLGCPDLNLAEVLALAQRHRIDAIELRSLDSTLDLPEYLARTFGKPTALAEYLRDSPVRIVALDTSLRLVGHAPADRGKFLEFVPWAEALGVAWLRVFDGKMASEEHDLEQAANTLRWWQSLRRAHGWRVDCMVETHSSLLDAARIRRFLAAAPGTAILWDSHHTWRLGGEHPVETWRQIAPQVVHVHVKDSIGVPDARNPYTHVLPGTGEFPMAALVEILRREFHGVVSLEWERHWHPELPSLETALHSLAGASWW